MICETWKTLRAEDFMAPNPVLCYGAGGAFQGTAPYMVESGIHIVGVMDMNKAGSVEVKGKEIPILTIQRAMEQYGTDVFVIVTIASLPVFRQVKQELIQYGYNESKIFDLNIWTWLTIPSEKSNCQEFAGYLNFNSASLMKCCKAGTKWGFSCEWFMEGKPPRESMDCFLEKRLYYMEESKRGRIPLFCRNCDFLTEEPVGDSTTITFYGFGDHTYCNADCAYCSHGCTVPRAAMATSFKERCETVLDTLEKVQQEGLLDKNGAVVFASGEITAHPYRENVYETLRRVLNKSPELELRILSNCIIYDQSIAQLLTLGKGSYIECDLDAGTAETYLKVKGFNKFDIVRENLIRYARFGSVKMKYIVLPGWNDSPADYEGTVRLLKELGSGEMLLSLEFELSRTGDRMRVREALYAAARLKVLLEENGLKATLPPEQWKKEYIPILERLCREIHNLYS